GARDGAGMLLASRRLPVALMVVMPAAAPRSVRDDVEVQSGRRRFAQLLDPTSERLERRLLSRLRREVVELVRVRAEVVELLLPRRVQHVDLVLSADAAEGRRPD